MMYIYIARFKDVKFKRFGASATIRVLPRPMELDLSAAHTATAADGIE